jgi:hypothetical protein
MSEPKANKKTALTRKQVKISPALHQLIDVESAKTGTPHYRLVEQMWEAYTERKKRGENAHDPESQLGDRPTKNVREYGSQRPRKSPSMDLTPDISQWASIFSDVLASGHAVAIEALLQNVIAFDLLIHRDPKGKDEHYTVPSPAEWRAGIIAKLLKESNAVTGSSEQGKRNRGDAPGARRGA